MKARQTEQQEPESGDVRPKITEVIKNPCLRSAYPQQLQKDPLLPFHGGPL